MDVSVGLWRKLSTEELMLLNCGVGEDSWESLGLQGDQSWVFIGRTDAETETLPTSCAELTHWERPWCWEGLGAGWKGNNRGWDGWMASPTRCSWVCVNSGCWWWTGREGGLACGYSWPCKKSDTTEQLNWTELRHAVRISEREIKKTTIFQTCLINESNFSGRYFENCWFYPTHSIYEMKLNFRKWLIQNHR